MRTQRTSWTSISFVITTLLCLLVGLLSSTALGLFVLTTDDILDETGRSLRRGNFRGLLFDGRDYYYLTSDGVFFSDGRLLTNLREAEQVGLNYVLSQNKVFKIAEGKLVSIGSVPPTMRSIVVKNDHIIGLDQGQIVCSYAGGTVWTIVTPATALKLSGDYLAAFAEQTQLFNVSNIKFPKLERFYPKYSDYAFFSGYHAFSDGSRIYIFRGGTRQGDTYTYRGPLQSDGRHLYSGNTLIGPDLVQRSLNFNVRLVIPTGREPRFVTGQVVPAEQAGTPTVVQGSQQEQPRPIVEELSPPRQEIFSVTWRVLLNDEIMGRPAVKGKTAFLATLKGTVMAISQGKVLWTYRIGFVVMGHVTVGRNVYVVSWDDTLYALGEDGTLRWKLKLDSDISQGPAWDGYYVYLATDSGTVYVVRDNQSSGVINSTFKTGTMPSTPPTVSLSGRIFVVDGLGNLWRDKAVLRHVGKVRNVAVAFETPYEGAQLGFTLVEENGALLRIVPLERETHIMRDNTVYMTFNEEIVDAVLGRRFLYILTQSGKLHIVERASRRILFTDTLQKAKFLSLSEGCLFVFGREVVCYNVGDDTPAGLWSSMFANPMNWNVATK